MTNPAPDSIAPSLAFLEELALEAISTLPDGMGQQVLVVEPYDVERGDRLAGLRTPVDSLLYDGNVGMWLYVDARGVIIARRRPSDRVQVLRGGLSTTISAIADAYFKPGAPLLADAITLLPALTDPK